MRVPIIARSVARTHAARFSGTQGYPQTKEGMRGLIDAFQWYAQSDDHADRIVADLLVDTVFCPRPSEIRRVALATGTQASRAPCERGCVNGFVFVDIKGVSYAKRCECRK